MKTLDEWFQKEYGQCDEITSSPAYGVLFKITAHAWNQALIEFAEKIEPLESYTGLELLVQIQQTVKKNIAIVKKMPL